MRLPHVRRFSRFTRHSLRSPQVTYHVELWTQPLHHWLAAWAYHRYDMTVFRLPGFKALDNLILGWKLRRGGGELALPWSAEQDCRCYHLTQRQRTTLATLEVDEQTYRRLARR